jgi:Tfp pilus assembly protein FimT
MMELVVVVIIIAVMFAVSLPTLRGVSRGNRLRSDVREIMSLMKYARTEAVFNGRTTEVFIDTEKNQFWLDLRTPDKKTGRYNPKDLKSTMERKRDLESGVWFPGITADEKYILKNGIIAFDFYPDGTASSGLISLTNRNPDKPEARGAEYTLELFPSTGMVELSEGDLDTVAANSGAKTHPLPDNYYENFSNEEAVRR